MQGKDIKLFNKAIHNIKRVAKEIEEERRSYHIEISKLRNCHDKNMKKLLKEQLEILEEVYELFDDLTETGDK